MHDLAVIVVSTNDVDWLRPCLCTLYGRAGDLDLDVVIADNESTDGTVELIHDEFPKARMVSCTNHGFGHANNRAALSCNARYLLFLNPDTELLAGTLANLVAWLDEHPDIGMASVKQVTPDGIVYPTIRRFPNAFRAFGEAIGCERFPGLRWLSPRVLDRECYEREFDCDWLTGAFMIVRAETLAGAGIFDERFFMSSEEVDLALRIKEAGWRVAHLPYMTILHHVHMGKPLGVKMEAQYAFARSQYARKHFSPLHRAVYMSVVKARYRLRLALGLISGQDSYRRDAAAGALRTLSGVQPPPYEVPPTTAVRPVAASAGKEASEPLLGALTRG